MKTGSAVLIALILVLGVWGGAYAQMEPSYHPPGTFVYGINDAGTVVGQYYEPYGTGWYGFSLSGTTYTTLNVPGSISGSTVPYGINNAGTVAGTYMPDFGGYVPGSPDQYGFSLSNGTYTTNTALANYPAFFPFPSGINNAGTIVGSYLTGSALYGFSLSGTTYTTLNGAESPYGINNAGTIVGSGRGGGFCLSNGTYITLNVPGASITDPTGINDAGTIVGSYLDASGMWHGFSLSNGAYTTLDYAYTTLDYALVSGVPIPGAILLFVPGLVGLAAMRRRFKK